VLGAGFVVREWLYLADSTTWLAVAKLALGTPLTILAGLVVLWAFRRTSTRLLARMRREHRGAEPLGPPRP